MVTNYQRGARFENYIKTLFQENGYYVCRSAGSKGAVDLVAIRRYENFNHTDILFIQCKRNMRMPKKEKDKLILLSRIFGAIPMLVGKRKKRMEAPLFINLETLNDESIRIRTSSKQQKSQKQRKSKSRSKHKV